MNKQELKKQLVVKQLGAEHTDQFNQLLRYVFQVTNEELLRSGYEDGELIRSKRPLLERADTFGWFKGEDLISLVCIYPCEVNIHGDIWPMGGLTGVGTYPEYAGLGLSQDLILLALKDMREKGQWISYLSPYSIPFYRRHGWEIFSDCIGFTVKDSQLPKQVEVPGYVERHSVEHQDVFEVYNKFARQAHGAMVRGAAEWEEYWRWENEEERTAGVYYNGDGVPTGWVIYWIEDDIFHVKEMVYLDQEARRGLWNFIGAHHSMVDAVKGNLFGNEPLAFYLDDSQIVETITPYFMARIVDVKEFLERFPFSWIDEPFCFRVADAFAPWNNGTFSVVGVENGRNIVVPVVVGQEAALDIRTLTSMLMNYRRASFFAKQRLILAEPETIKLLEHLIPNQQPYFADDF
ncbi:conserved hypothetical protein [uncultured delta proteobacterium]|uniref:N-acetyltransferase domain-containing protein n=1 Tax=uncultured delta proteobacterium TaxID=34034 RepID=A0A212KBN8_9DELT|nr:conserved hypothetical protein [uncultured delta proteobacterium]